MDILMNSDEFKAWHEVGHAAVCLHWGGDLYGIEFLTDDKLGSAVTRGCWVLPRYERSVACGGFAAEYFLLCSGFIGNVDLSDPLVVSEVSSLVFSNAWRDCQDFIGRTVTEDNPFTKEEKEEFMNYAIKHVAPIIAIYFSKMKVVVNDLLAARRIDGKRVREVLQISTS